MGNAIKRKNDRLLLSVYLQPNAKKTQVVGLFQEHIKIQIMAPAIENKANQCLIKWLAKEFKVPSSRVSLLQGAKSRIKRLAIDAPSHYPEWFQKLN